MTQVDTTSEPTLSEQLEHEKLKNQAHLETISALQEQNADYRATITRLANYVQKINEAAEQNAEDTE